MIKSGDIIIVAVSGGPDSLCLLDILNSIKNKQKISIIIAHVNHGIRKRESKIEARYVRLKAHSLRLPFEQITVSIPTLARESSLSVEQIGRKVRYDFFKKLSKKYKAQKIALGHHADDQAETILMRIIRGSGVQGLRGIPAKRDKFIRPLIDCNRSEIISYCERNNITYCIDSSNKESVYLRNKIRNQLIPLLAREYNSSICKNILQLQAIVQDELSYLDKETEEHFIKIMVKRSPSDIVLDVTQLIELPVALQRRVIRKGLGYLNKYLTDIKFIHIESIRKLCFLNSGEKYINLPGNIKVRKSYKNLEIGYKENLPVPDRSQSSNKWEYILPVCEEKTYFQTGNIKMIIKKYDYSDNIKEKILHSSGKSEVYLDYDKLTLPLIVRNRRPGDRFKPLNSNYFKKLKTFLIDKKVPLHEREDIILVVDNFTNIVWIAGLQLDDRFKVTEKTKKVLYIKNVTH